MTVRKEYKKAWRESNKAKIKEYRKAWYEAHKEECNTWQKAYSKSDLNSFGQRKQSIRLMSQRILKRMKLHIDNYEIHHCFGYEDANKFIYISRELHIKIHKYLREHNINAATNHWTTIRDIVNNTKEFTFIKC